ncbi:MAG TPA: Gfo/Idh/MocA family oxidoreductase [Stellaceae bacterium]
MIRAAIVGLGRWGRTLVNSVQGKSDKLRFTHAVSRDPAHVAEFAAEHELHVVDSLAAVLAQPEIAAVVLATPHSQHLAQVLAAAAAGKHVFCEKPLTLTRAEAERAVAACEEAAIVLGVGHDKRFSPAMVELMRIVASGELGKILHIEGNFSNEVAATQFTPWRDSAEEAPAGGLTGTGIHVLDAFVRMIGPVRVVHARLLAHKPPPDPQDTLSVLLEFDSGVSGTLAAVRSTPMFWRVHVFGRDGSVEALGRTDLVVRRSGREPEHLRLLNVDSARANLDAFADAAAGRAPYPITMREMVDVVAAFEAIVKSAAADGQPQDV